MSEQNLFAEFMKQMAFDRAEYLVEGKVEDLSDFMKKMIESASSIIKENVVGEIKVLGGSIKKKEDKFNEFIKKVENEAENEKYKNIKKNIKEYIKLVKELVEKYCVAVIPVKELPWENVIFMTVPIFLHDKKIQLLNNSIAYCGDIKCVVSKTTIYSKMKGGTPLFAPYIGELELNSTVSNESFKNPLSEDFTCINAIIESLESPSVKNQLAKYHEGYQRHGEPICDFLMKDEELMRVMDKLTSGLESKRVNTEFAACAIALPNVSNGSTLMVVTDESNGSGSEKFLNCFEALLKFSAACCEAPSTSKEGKNEGMSTPGGQQLATWTQEDLARDAQQRGGAVTPPGMAVWTEEELTKAASERSTGLPPGMEYWTEKDLEELAKKRQGGALDIPEWKPEPNMLECANCGYALRKGWDECPICGTPAGTNISSKPSAEKESDIVSSSASENDEEKDESPENTPPEQ